MCVWSLTLEKQMVTQTFFKNSLDVVDLDLCWRLNSLVQTTVQGKNNKKKRAIFQDVLFRTTYQESSLALVTWHKTPRNQIPEKGLLCLLCAPLIVSVFILDCVLLKWPGTSLQYDSVKKPPSMQMALIVCTNMKLNIKGSVFMVSFDKQKIAWCPYRFDISFNYRPVCQMWQQSFLSKPIIS